jgi:hypothetical protein
MPKNIPGPDPGQDFAEEISTNRTQRISQIAEGKEEKGAADSTSNNDASNTYVAWTNSIVQNYRELWTMMRPAFRQDRTLRLLTEVVTGLLLTTARRKTLTSAMIENGLSNSDNSKYYALFRDYQWDPLWIQDAILRECLKFLKPGQRPVLAMDDTAIPKPYSGDEEFNEYVAWGIDHTGPKWMVQLMRGIRMEHMIFLIPDRTTHRPWPISIRFEPVKTRNQAVREAKGIKLEKRKRAKRGVTPPIDVRKPEPWDAFKERGRRPRKKADNNTDAAPAEATSKPLGRPRKGYEDSEEDKDPKVAPLMDSGELAIHGAWKALEEAGEAHRGLLLATDGSYCNGRIFHTLPDGVKIIARARRNCSLFTIPERPVRNQVYGERLQTPEEFAKGRTIPDTTVDVHYGGALQTLRIKEMPFPVRWKGTSRISIRVIVVQAVPYKLRKKKKGYNQRAYLFTTDLVTPIQELCQAYCDRWSIEDVHRGAKTDVGLGDPQVGTKSTEKVFTAVMAGFSMLSLAAYGAHGPTRTGDYRPRPKWLRNIDERHARENKAMGILTAPRRPSTADILQLFREEWQLFKTAEAAEQAEQPLREVPSSRLA